MFDWTILKHQQNQNAGASRPISSRVLPTADGAGPSNPYDEGHHGDMAGTSGAVANSSFQRQGMAADTSRRRLLGVPREPAPPQQDGRF